MYYKNGTITPRPRIPVSNPEEKHYLKFGWKTFVNERPEYNPETHRLEKGEIEETDTEAVQKWNVVELTKEEIEARNQPSEIELMIDERINRIADIIESGKQGKELADEIRNQTRRA